MGDRYTGAKLKCWSNLNYRNCYNKFDSSDCERENSLSKAELYCTPTIHASNNEIWALPQNLLLGDLLKLFMYYLLVHG